MHAYAVQATRCNDYAGDIELLDATHRGCHKFVPRHEDELFVEIGDAIHVLMESEDLWCEGSYGNNVLYNRLYNAFLYVFYL